MNTISFELESLATHIKHFRLDKFHELIAQLGIEKKNNPHFSNELSSILIDCFKASGGWKDLPEQTKEKQLHFLEHFSALDTLIDTKSLLINHLLVMRNSAYEVYFKKRHNIPHADYKEIKNTIMAASNESNVFYLTFQQQQKMQEATKLLAMSYDTHLEKLDKYNLITNEIYFKVQERTGKFEDYFLNTLHYLRNDKLAILNEFMTPSKVQRVLESFALQKPEQFKKFFIDELSKKEKDIEYYQRKSPTLLKHIAESDFSHMAFSPLVKAKFNKADTSQIESLITLYQDKPEHLWQKFQDHGIDISKSDSPFIRSFLLEQNLTDKGNNPKKNKI